MGRKKRKATQLPPSSPVPPPHPRPHPSAREPDAPTSTTAHDRSKRCEHDSFYTFQKSQLAWARFWAEKAAKLASPFATLDDEDEAVHVKVDQAGLKIHIGSKKVSGQMVSRYDGSDSNPPLSREAVADIVMQTRADCPKAQAWLSAHACGCEQVGPEKRMLGIIEQEHRRKATVESLRYRTMIALKASEASKDEVREVMAILPPVQLKATSAITTEAEMEAQIERVEKAHERLQKTLAELKDFNCA
ncbi:hypothetical protein ASPACDRAFT_45826 [Aspergillus aculeatus ATCC 16872]|uniref:Uncharacterized protein n=1 Tax=Aspergillus aculeatus (strain ATCC 16872 / CBS 172.66 / WB 5094) TaxID=690307 RepID=A0A1L9WNJ1_ASPA1|nr:uncharacterized protein ASPACDRAFT_45826 [Aspergillus aculeatus ATCC 16872]OJJ97728.1 hypothetical protein ASPACDRAFT_45826 [Aspergillus aculeatus ATCC 16872]